MARTHIYFIHQRTSGPAQWRATDAPSLPSIPRVCKTSVHEVFNYRWIRQRGNITHIAHIVFSDLA
jgi:hypothetical protein